ncbi:MAG: hypothetical protein A3J76_05665 [Candidatus Moranbacteria bacterium RBG_13_45_13]|nr:MAG: hypothetical protein A3J76_05665 [Candidatus Moranbacteria bacterium RBG_13_45_13]
MSNWSKSVIFGGIYPAPFGEKEGKNNSRKIQFSPVSADSIHERGWAGTRISQLENLLEMAKKSWEKSKSLYLSIKNNLKSHIRQKQELYWPVLVAIVLLCFVFVSKIAFAKEFSIPNNLPIEDSSKLNLVGFENHPSAGKTCLVDGKNIINSEKLAEASKNFDKEKEELKTDIASIVKNTPMAAMVDSISEKDRTVAAFIVGIAMKESKFGVYSPKVAGRDCYNYWGFKGGGKTVAGGYTCFSSPEDAVEAVGKRIEKMVAKGVRNPAQAISWKCGSSCAGHGAENVRKWIADVGVNFYKINS